MTRRMLLQVFGIVLCAALLAGFVLAALQVNRAREQDFAQAPPDVVRLCRNRVSERLGEIRSWGPGRSGYDPDLPVWTYLNEVRADAAPVRVRSVSCRVDVGGPVPLIVRLDLGD